MEFTYVARADSNVEVVEPPSQFHFPIISSYRSSCNSRKSGHTNVRIAMGTPPSTSSDNVRLVFEAHGSTKTRDKAAIRLAMISSDEPPRGEPPVGRRLNAVDGGSADEDDDVDDDDDILQSTLQ